MNLTTLEGCRFFRLSFFPGEILEVQETSTTIKVLVFRRPRYMKWPEQEYIFIYSRGNITKII